MTSISIPLTRVVDLTDSDKNVLFNVSHEEACAILRERPAEALASIDGGRLIIVAVSIIVVV